MFILMFNWFKKSKAVKVLSPIEEAEVALAQRVARSLREDAAWRLINYQTATHSKSDDQLFVGRSIIEFGHHQFENTAAREMVRNAFVEFSAAVAKKKIDALLNDIGS